MPEIKEYERYLGLLAVVGRKKKASLNYIKDRVQAKLQGWKEKILSQAGKEVLLKVVVQAIPTFAIIRADCETSNSGFPGASCGMASCLVFYTIGLCSRCL